jgi:hypothetical protein
VVEEDEGGEVGDEKGGKWGRGPSGDMTSGPPQLLKSALPAE